MDEPFVIRTSNEDENGKANDTEGYMVDRVISYFTHPDPEGHRKKWKKRKKNKKSPMVDYYYV